MVTRRGFLLGAAVILPRVAAAQASLEFIHLTDTHVMKLDGVDERWIQKRRHYEHTREALPGFFRQLKSAHNPGLILHTGDAIDAFTFHGANSKPIHGQVDAFAAIARQSPIPIYLALGNHDVVDYGASLTADQSVVEEARAAWIQALPCFQTGTYYAFSRQVGSTRWRFVVLNNSFQAAFPNRKQPEYDGAPDRGQLDWLARETRQYPADPLVIGVHIPMRESSWAQVAEALGKRGHLTVMFTGHIHTNNHIQELPSEGAPAFHVATLAYAQGERHWRRVRLLEDCIEVFKTGAPANLDRALTAMAV